jgi:hypothetical protein
MPATLGEKKVLDWAVKKPQQNRSNRIIPQVAALGFNSSRLNPATLGKHAFCSAAS